MTSEAIIAIATAVGAIGALFTAIWAIHVYNANRRENQVTRFRSDIVDIVRLFEELMSSFQDHIVVTCQQLFASDSSETKTILDKVLPLMEETDKQAFEKSLAGIKHDIEQWTIYSLDANVLSQGEKPRLASYATMQSIRAFLPVLYEFIDNVSGFILRTYQHELNVIRIRKYTLDSLPLIWESKQEGSLRMSNESDLILHWRGYISAHMNQYTNDINFVQMFNAARQVISKYAELYLRATNQTLWKFHKLEARTNINKFEAGTRIESLILIVKWKLGKKDPNVFTELVQSITRLEQILKRGEKESSGED